MYFYCICWLFLSSAVDSLVVYVPSAHIDNIVLTKNGNRLPEYLVSYSLTEDLLVQIDTGRALFDRITVTPAADWTCDRDDSVNGHCWSQISVLDPEYMTEWRTGFSQSDDEHHGAAESFDLTYFITERRPSGDRDATAEQSVAEAETDIEIETDKEAVRGEGRKKNKLLSITGYNGEFVLLFRLQYLFDVIDEFIIIESRYAHNGEKKPHLFFTTPENTVKFAPYMSKITYVVMEEHPPMPPQWVAAYSDMFPSKLNEMRAFWNQDAQNLLAKFFLRPTAELGDEEAHTYVLVSDCDEIPNRDTLAALSIQSFPPNRVLYMIMVMYAYSFYNLEPESWTYLYITPVNNFFDIENHLAVRHGKNKIDFALQNGGFHLTSFMSFDDIRRKIRTFAHTTYNSFEHILTCEHIRDSIAGGTDMLLRAELADGYLRRERDTTHGLVGGVSVRLVPEGWEAVQEELEQLQRDSCECCTASSAEVSS
jgi:beta-1,4-mannosyl-glycoprotein beta-1,4-N-acetylglucosaminyltransferase